MTAWIRDIAAGLVLILWLGGAFAAADIVQAAVSG